MTAATLLTACASGPTVHDETRSGDGDVPDQIVRDRGIRDRGTLVDGLQQGKWQHFYPGGQLESTGDYRDDERDGQWQHWHENGEPSMVGRYAHGRQVGDWEFFFDNGQPMCRGSYRDGREHGPWQFFHRTGQLQQSGCFYDGRRVLTWRAFDAAGNVAQTGAYHHDRPVGIWQSGSGANARRMEYPLPAGVELVQERWDHGALRREGFTKAGVATGPWATHHETGTLRAFGALHDGAPAGPWATRCAGGALLATGEVTNGRMHGPWRVRGSDAPIELRGRPVPPWSGSWSAATMADEHEPLQVAACWLAEACAPPPVAGRELPADPPVAPAAVRPTDAALTELEAPTDPGHFTVRERKELELYRRYYRDGFLPRRASLGKTYGAATDARTLGNGDAEHGDELIGNRLPVTRFPDQDGALFDLDSLRGKRVLLVILRGFASQVCVYCFAQTTELAPFLPRLHELDCELVVLFPGTRSRFEAFQAACADEFGEAGPPYRMVYDPDLDLAKDLRIEGNLARPSSLILDRDGVVRHAYVAESVDNVADRPPAKRLVELVEGMAN